MLNQSVRRLAAWFAMAAMLLAVCTPTLAQLNSKASNGSLMPVCSSTGIKLIQPQADAGNSQTSDLPDSQASHCLWCQLHAALSASLPSEPYSIPLAAQSLPDLWQYQTVPIITVAWPRAQSRAPPLA